LTSKLQNYYVCFSDESKIWQNLKTTFGEEKAVISSDSIKTNIVSFRIAKFNRNKSELQSPYSDPSAEIIVSSEDNFPLLFGIVGGVIAVATICILATVLLLKRYRGQKSTKSVRKEFTYNPQPYFGHLDTSTQRNPFVQR
jgi:hypothetical protein